MKRSRAVLLTPALLVLATTGCATRGWVQETLTKERVQTEERVQHVERRVADEAERIAILDGRVGEEARRVDALDVTVKSVGETAQAAGESARVASDRAETALATAATARERADAAVARADETENRVTKLWTNRHKRTVVDTMQVHFGFNRWELDDGAQTALLGIVEELKKNPGLEIVLQGYTDGQGPRDYNLELSRRRVEAVRRFLVERGVELWRVNGIGLGPAPAPNVPDREKRRVSVLLTLAE